MLLITILMLLNLLQIKNTVTFNNRLVIIKAISEYRHNQYVNREYAEVFYSDIEGHWKTLFRIWDWGYKNILPKEKYEIIEKYIKKS